MPKLDFVDSGWRTRGVQPGVPTHILVLEEVGPHLDGETEALEISS
ncbi:MAG: hypothetical protein ACE5JX_07900 [Acidobacteriota bacterium]